MTSAKKTPSVTESLQPLFKPRAIAVIGASENPDKLEAS